MGDQVYWGTAILAHLTLLDPAVLGCLIQVHVGYKRVEIHRSPEEGEVKPLIHFGAVACEIEQVG
jgi:hypothetical protein